MLEGEDVTQAKREGKLAHEHVRRRAKAATEEISLKHSRLTALIFIALILGVVVGHFAPDFAVKMRPFAMIFLRIVKMIIAPLLFATLVVGIASHSNIKSLGKIGLKTIVYFELVTTIALIIYFFCERAFSLSSRSIS